MNNDLISRSALKAYIRQSDLHNHEKMALLSAASNVPTIDASPVVRGEWAYDVAKGHYCTNCGWEMSTHCQIPTYQHNYCPSCGAKNGRR